MSKPQTLSLSPSKSRYGFRFHPSLLSLHSSLFPSPSLSTSLLLSLEVSTPLLSIPSILAQLPLTLQTLQEMEKLPILLFSSDGSPLPSPKPPVFSLYLSPEKQHSLLSFITFAQTLPMFSLIPFSFPLLFNLTSSLSILDRSISLTEIQAFFQDPSLLSLKWNPYLSKPSFTSELTRSAASAIDRELSPEQTPEKTPSPDQTSSALSLLSDDEILSHLSDLLEPPLQRPTPHQLTELLRVLSPSQSHALFPVSSFDYRPILHTALEKTNGLLSSQVLSFFPAFVSTETPLA